MWRNKFEEAIQMSQLWWQSRKENHSPHPDQGPKVFDFEDVPVLVCAQCGEGWLEAEVLSSIRERVRNHASAKKCKGEMTSDPKPDTMG